MFVFVKKIFPFVIKIKIHNIFHLSHETETAYTTTWSKESDVYSFGVFLLEMLTRKRAVDASFPEGIDLVVWVRSVWNGSEEIEQMIDATLLEELQDTRVMEQVHDVMFIALKCTEKEPRRRPTMRDVVKLLDDANLY